MRGVVASAARGLHSERVKLSFGFAAALLVASPALAEQPPVRPIRSALAGEVRAQRQIRTSLDGSERAALGATGVRRFIRLTLDDSKSVATFPPLDAFAAREVLDAESSGPVRSSAPPVERPLRKALRESGPPPEQVARPIRLELSGDRVALSTPLPARRIRTTLD